MTAPAPTPGAPEAPPAAPPTAPPAAPAPTPAPSGQAPAPVDWDGKVESLDPKVQKMITDLRKEAGDSRTAKNAESERVKAILKAAGIDVGDEDPVKAAENSARERDEARAEARVLKVERAVEKAARTAGADEDLLTAVLAHQGHLAKLDPTAADFTAALDALVKAAVDSNPKLKTGRVPVPSSVDHAGGSGEGAHDLDAQIADATKNRDFVRAISLKRQKAYGAPA